MVPVAKHAIHKTCCVVPTNRLECRRLKLRCFSAHRQESSYGRGNLHTIFLACRKRLGRTYKNDVFLGVMKKNPAGFTTALVFTSSLAQAAAALRLCLTSFHHHLGKCLTKDCVRLPL